jgi:hypothetical protein
MDRVSILSYDGCYNDCTLAVPAQNPKDKRALTTRGSSRKLSGVQYAAVRLYSEGKSRRTVIELLAARAYPTLDRQQAERVLRKRLRAWEETQWFRDAVYDGAMRETDMDIPRIMAGVRQRARRGRVDAARLALEVTGRHNPRGEESTPAVVQITFGGAVPRPGTRSVEPDAQLYPQLAPPEPEVIEEAEIVEEQPNGPRGRKGLRHRLGL